MRVLICGSRHWADRETIRRFIAALGPDDIVIHGRAPDTCMAVG